MTEGSGVVFHCERCDYQTVFFPESENERRSWLSHPEAARRNCTQCGSNLGALFDDKESGLIPKRRVGK